MLRRLSLSLVFLIGLSGSYALAADNPPLSPEMQCIGWCRYYGGSWEACVDACTT